VRGEGEMGDERLNLPQEVALERGKERQGKERMRDDTSNLPEPQEEDLQQPYGIHVGL
jgi:hypothetical protein